IWRGGGLLGGVRTGRRTDAGAHNFAPEIQHPLCDPAHSDPANPDKMNLIDSLKHGVARSLFRPGSQSAALRPESLYAVRCLRSLRVVAGLQSNPGLNPPNVSLSDPHC